MKYLINASNRTLEFNVDDVSIFHNKIIATNTWTDLYANYDYRVDPFDHVIAVHVYGKNTAASPQINLCYRTKNMVSTVTTSQMNIHHNKLYTGADKLTGLVDINQVYTFNESMTLAGLPANDNMIQVFIDPVGTAFTGYLYVSVYVVRNSR